MNIFRTQIEKSKTTLTKRIIYIILSFFLLFDLGFSFLQHMGQPLDGDLAWNIVPSNDVKPILKNPLGTVVVFRNQSYPNPNRFFCHWTIQNYFKKIPLLLQKIVTPINSIYFSCAIFKIFVQIFLIVLLSIAITGSCKWYKPDFIIAAILVTPLFQTNGYVRYMGIIDPSISYTFFYAFPCALLIFYLMPFILQNFHEKKTQTKVLIKILWIPFAFVICLSGPLNPGIILIFSILIFVNKILKESPRFKKSNIIRRIISTIRIIPQNYWFYLIPVSILSIYSLYIGKFNSNNINKSLIELFSRIPKGIYFQLTQKLGFPVLFMILTLNVIIIKRNFRTQEGRKILTVFKWFGIFTLLYILLLPFGGFRSYRPNNLRYDTIMPVTLGLIFFFGSTTLYIIKSMTTRHKMWYISIIITVIFIYTNSDKAEFDKNNCERIALEKISSSKDTIIQIPGDCTVLSWNTIEDPKNSELNAQLLKIWGITKEKKLYYNY